MIYNDSSQLITHKSNIWQSIYNYSAEVLYDKKTQSRKVFKKKIR